MRTSSCCDFIASKVIDSSSDGVRVAKLENQRLLDELKEARDNIDLLNVWNSENMRIIATQEEKMAQAKSTYYALGHWLHAIKLHRVASFKSLHA